MYLKLLIIFGVTLFFYRRTLSYGYVIDDMQVATHERTGKFWRDVWYQVRGHAYFNARREHAITLAFHLLNSCLIFFVFGKTDIAFLAALFFGLNPVNNQASVWLSGKVYSISTSLILLGLCLKPLFPLLYFASFYFSLNGVLSPLLFLFMPPMFFAALPGLLTLVFRKRLVYEPKRRYVQGSPWMREMSPRKILISIKTFGYYFRLCLFPFKLGMCHKYLHEYGLSKQETEKHYVLDKYFWLGIAILLFLPIGFFMKIPIFGLFWFSILTFQWCNFVIVSHPICERYIYLANVGLMYFLATILSKIPYGGYIALITLTYYATRLWQFLPAYKNNFEYFSSNRENFNDVAIAYNQQGLEAIRFGNPHTAIDLFNQGLIYRPHDFRINYNLANLLIGMGRNADALPYIYRADHNLERALVNSDVWVKGIKSMKDAVRKQGIGVLN